jgi:amino acid transporter
MLGAWSTPVALDCDCSLQDALDRLGADPGREAWLSPKAGLAGRLDPSSLWLWLAPKGRNSFQAFFRGRLTTRAGGCRLEGEVRLARWNVAVAAFLLVVAVLFFSAAVQEFIAAIVAGRPAYPEVPVVAVAASFLLALLFFNSYGLRSYAHSRDELVSFLERTLVDVPRSAVAPRSAPEPGA